MSESRFLICPFTEKGYFITGVMVCPSCGRIHEKPYYIKGKDIKWYQKKNQWMERNEWKH